MRQTVTAAIWDDDYRTNGEIADLLIDAIDLHTDTETLVITRLLIFDRRGLQYDFATNSVTTFLKSWGGTNGGLASRWVRSATLCAIHPVVHDLFRLGKLTVDHLDLLSRARKRHRSELFDAHIETLLDLAAKFPVAADFARVIKHWTDAADDLTRQINPEQRYESRHLNTAITLYGMMSIHGLIDETGAPILKAALDDLSQPDPTDTPDEPRPYQQRQVDALVELARQYLQTRNTTATGTTPICAVDLVITADLVAEWLQDNITDLPDNIPDNILDALQHNRPHPHDLDLQYNIDADADADADQHDVDGSGGGAVQEHPGERANHHPDLEPGTATATASGAGNVTDDPGDRDHRGDGCCGNADDPPRCYPGSPVDDTEWLGVHPNDLINVGRSILNALAFGPEILNYGPVDTNTAHYLLCDAWIGAAIFDTNHQPLVAGRQIRLFNRAQRRLLAIRDGGCVWPGCDKPLNWCQLHHLTPWKPVGETNIDNGAHLCTHHHILVHHGWSLTYDPHNGWTATHNTPHQNQSRRTISQRHLTERLKARRQRTHHPQPAHTAHRAPTRSPGPLPPEPIRGPHPRPPRGNPNTKHPHTARPDH